MDILLEYYNHLGTMKTAFKELPTPYVSKSDLSNLGVQFSRMSLHPDTVDSQPRFCKPFQAREFDHLFENAEKPEWRKPAPHFNGNLHEGYGLEQWFSDCLGYSSYDWHLLASSKWFKQE
jgi:hypothetical protein